MPGAYDRAMDADPRAWRPQAFGHGRARNVADPVIEPAWDGIRVLAHLDVAADRAEITDVTGADLASEHAPIAGALLGALAADTAIVDGYLTDQATRPTENRTIVGPDIPSFGEQTSQLFLGRRGAELMSGRGRPGRIGDARTGSDAEWAIGDESIAFVAIDLVALDGRPLLEIPLLERKRLQSKKVSKTQSVTSQIPHEMEKAAVHIGPSDHVPWLDDRKWAYVRLEGRAFGDVPLSLEYKLEVWDSPNSAGVIIDAVRAAKIAKDRGIGGPILSAASYFMKSPPVQYSDDAARDAVDKFIRGEVER